MSAKKFRFSRDFLKIFGFLLLCVGSFGNVIIERGIMHTNTMTLEALEAATQPGGPLAQWKAVAMAASLVSAIAVPIYARLFAEGWGATSDRKKYLIRLAVLALVSEFAYDWAVTGSLLEIGIQNPLWGLLIAAVVLAIYDYFNQPGLGSVIMKVSAVVASVFWVLLLQVELGIATVLLVACFRLLPQKKPLRIACSVAASLPELSAVLGLPFAFLYDGSESRLPKWLFYGLYPLQFVIFGILVLFL